MRIRHEGRAKYYTATRVCATKSTKDERNVPDPVKTEVYNDYGAARCADYCSGPQGCEIDHLISLDHGGANTIDNLWPQPYDGEWSAHDKDRLEGKLHHMVCKEKTITLKEAQKEIATDRIAAYIGAVRPFTPQNPLSRLIRTDDRQRRRIAFLPRAQFPPKHVR
jgi:hypothetical protein